jgi:hypothetical protein
MKILSAALFCVALCGMLLLPSPAMATGCTATLTCNNACSVRVNCPPAGDCFRSCSAPASTLTCNGSTSCSVGTSSVTCDGVAHSCPTTSQCTKGSNFVQCGSITSTCPARCPL